MQNRIYFWNPNLDGEGHISNISKGGCRVSCETPVEVGMTFELWIYTDGSQWPLKIEEAEVCWTQGTEFGFHFSKIWLSQRDRLRALLEHLRTHVVPLRMPKEAVVGLSVHGTRRLASDISLVNISISGCTLHASATLPISVGSHVSIEVTVAERTRPLSIQEGVVRWITRLRAGIQFVTIGHEDRDRLLQHIRTFKWVDTPIEW
jgi:hypothetical protein